MVVDQTMKRCQFATAEADIRGETYGIEPELGVAFCLLNMDMRRLLPLIAKKEEAISSDTKDRRHTTS
jgi:hypothetical protein